MFVMTIKEGIGSIAEAQILTKRQQGSSLTFFFSFLNLLGFAYFSLSNNT